MVSGSHDRAMAILSRVLVEAYAVGDKGLCTELNGIMFREREHAIAAAKREVAAIDVKQMLGG